MRFETFVKELSRYESVRDGTITKYLREGKVVATQEKNIIVMYFSCPKHVVWSNYDVAVLAVIKDFAIVKNLRKRVADVIVVVGLCKKYNTIRRINSTLVLEDSREDLPENKCLGTIGSVNDDGIFKLYDSNTTLEIQQNMRSFTVNSLHYSILKEKNSRRAKKKPKFIQAKDYKVYDVIMADERWYKERISITRQQNYHQLGKVVVTK